MPLILPLESFSQQLAVLGELVQVLAAVEALGEGGVVRVEHVGADLEADQVEQLGGRHRQAERRHALVDDLERRSVVDRVHRLAEHLGQNTIHHESGGVGGDDGVLPQLRRR